MKHWTLPLIILLLSIQSTFGQAPTNNPISEFYNGAEGYPAWTDQIRWNNVYNMATFDYGGCASCAGNDFEKFKYVRDIAYAAGGGVLYYPAGTYRFSISDAPNSEGLMLKKGVVIRGERPATDARAVTNFNINAMSVTDHGLNSMPTKFVFDTTNLNGQMRRGIPKMWNQIGIKKGTNEAGLHEVSHVGVCWVEMEFGYVYFGFDATGWAPTYGQAAQRWANSIEPWKSQRNPDGTHPMDHFAGNRTWNQGDSMMMGAKRFVFGVHVKHGGVPNYVLAHGYPDSTFVAEDAPYHFGAKISLYGRDLFVANNVISKATYSFPVTITCRNGNISSRPLHTIDVPFDYGKGLSIDLNKNYVAGFVNRSQVDNPSSQYAPNVILRDNWIYNHSNKSLDAGGSWMVLKNNICRREFYNTTDVYNSGVTPPIWGTFTSNGRCRTMASPDDYLARGFTLSPFNAWADSNMIAGLGTQFDNSGEAIMVQDHLNGSECYSLAITNNRVANRSNIFGRTGWMGVWNSHTVGLYMGFNYVASNVMFVDRDNYGADISIVKHTDPETGNVWGPFGDNIRANVKDQRNFDCATGEPQPDAPTVTVKDTADFVLISWSNVEHEAGYKVQRRRAGAANWTTIAYRPRQETGGLVTFGFGPTSNGNIATNDGYPIAPWNTNTWDGRVRNMNPPVWRDYTKMAGEFQYRVIAVACEDNDVAASDPVTVTVVITDAKASTNELPNDITLYPVPASDVMFVKGSELAGQQITITDYTGRAVLKTTASDNAIRLNIAHLSPGMYFVQTKAEGKPVQVKRFMVK